MKNVILFLTLLAASLGLRAQDSIQDSTRRYASFFGENATEWNVLWEDFDFYYHYRYWVAGDTVIGDYAYKTVLGEGVSNGASSAKSLPIWMREDTLTGRLWIRHGILPDGRVYHDTVFVERLVCDMSLDSGNTIRLAYYESSGGYTYEFYYTVESVGEYDGRRRLLLSSQYGDIAFYEGAGSTAMFFPTLAGVDTWLYLLDSRLGCVFKDDTLAFSEPFNYLYGFDNCELESYVGVDEAGEAFSLALYPNPCGERLQIANLPEGARAIYVTDMLGRRVYSTDRPADAVPTAHLPQGLYRLTVLLQGNRQYSLTFVKR